MACQVEQLNSLLAFFSPPSQTLLTVLRFFLDPLYDDEILAQKHVIQIKDNIRNITIHLPFFFRLQTLQDSYTSISKFHSVYHIPTHAHTHT